MLKEAFQYAYINAKIRALKSLLLAPSDYQNLLGVSGYSGLAECLRVTSYGAALSLFPQEGMGTDLKSVPIPFSFDRLIHLFYQDLFDCYGKVIRSLSGNRKLLIQHLYQKYELENLKAILRIVCYEKPRENVEQMLLPTIEQPSEYGSGRNFSRGALLQSKSVEEILSQLKRTCYYRPLQNALYRFKEEKETFPLEMALDLSYYNQLWKIISSLGRRERKITRSILGVQMDILNITWIFRFKEIYHFSPEEILNYGLMQGCHISPELRKKLAYSVDRKDVLTNLAGTPYKALLERMGIQKGTGEKGMSSRISHFKSVNIPSDPASANSDSSSTIEYDSEISSVHLWRYLLAVARKNWQGFPFHIGIVLDYVLFKEIEVRDLISITEAKRLNLSREMVSNYLIQTFPCD